MRHGGSSEISGLEGDGCDVEDTSSEALEDRFGFDGKYLFVEDITIVVVTDDFHTVLEGLDVHLLEEGHFGVTDSLAFSADQNFL